MIEMKRSFAVILLATVLLIGSGMGVHGVAAACTGEYFRSLNRTLLSWGFSSNQAASLVWRIRVNMCGQ